MFILTTISIYAHIQRINTYAARLIRVKLNKVSLIIYFHDVRMTEMATALKQELKDYRQEVDLLDGRKIVIRMITSDDKEPLRAFYARLSDETRFLRFLYSKGELNEDELKNFCDVDYYNNLGLVAERTQNEQKEIIGVGRFYRLPSSTHTAEVAFVVQDSEQRKGIGTHLLKHLAVLAWKLDIYFFLGEVLEENTRMLSIFRKADPEMNQTIDSDSTCMVTLSIEETMFRMP